MPLSYLSANYSWDQGYKSILSGAYLCLSKGPLKPDFVSHISPIIIKMGFNSINFQKITIYLVTNTPPDALLDLRTNVCLFVYLHELIGPKIYIHTMDTVTVLIIAILVLYETCNNQIKTQTGCKVSCTTVRTIFAKCIAPVRHRYYVFDYPWGLFFCIEIVRRAAITAMNKGLSYSWILRVMRSTVILVCKLCSSLWYVWHVLPWLPEFSHFAIVRMSLAHTYYVHALLKWLPPHMSIWILTEHTCGGDAASHHWHRLVSVPMCADVGGCVSMDGFLTLFVLLCPGEAVTGVVKTF